MHVSNITTHFPAFWLLIGAAAVAGVHADMLTRYADKDHYTASLGMEQTSGGYQTDKNML
jgi:hypothetical protein